MVLTKLKLNKVHDRFSYIGFSMWKKATTASIINVVLSEEGGQALQEIVVTGSRTPVSNTKVLYQ
jgi:iron complex outermembrane receptor protein